MIRYEWLRDRSGLGIVEQLTVTADAGPVSPTQRILARATVAADMTKQGEDGKAGEGHQQEEHISLRKRNH